MIGMLEGADLDLFSAGSLDLTVEELESLESPGWWKVVGVVSGGAVAGGLIYGGIYVGTGVAIT